MLYNLVTGGCPLRHGEVATLAARASGERAPKAVGADHGRMRGQVPGKWPVTWIDARVRGLM